MATKKVQNKEDGEQHKRMIVFEEEVDEDAVKRAFLVVEKGTVVRQVKSRKLRPPTLVRLSEDHDCLFYKTPQYCIGAGKVKQVPVSAILDVRRGWGTDRFMKAATKVKFNTRVQESCCFSAVYRRLDGIQKSADFVAETPEERKHWLVALWRLIADAREAALHFNEQDWLKKHFQAADTNKNGVLSFDEVLELMKKLNVQLSEKDYKRQFLMIGSRKNDNSGTPSINYEDFELFFRSLTKRPELKAIMRKYSKLGFDLWTAEDLKKFLETSQGFQVSSEECKSIIQQLEPDSHTRREGNLSVHGFRLLLLSKWGSMMKPQHAQTVFQDMNQPLCEYFINSTHNTYLLGHQLMGDATIEGYIGALKTGARMLELDIWEGENDEPVVTHGYTLVSATPLINVVRAIDTYAFHASPYPLILSLENHCGLESQIRVAHIFAKIFGDKIHLPPSSQNILPSPEQLKHKILLKCKKLSEHKHAAENDEDEFFDDVYEVMFGTRKPSENATAPNVGVIREGDITLPNLGSPTLGDKAKKKQEKVPIAHEFSELIALKAVKLNDVQREVEEHPWNSHVSLTESKARNLLDKDPDMITHYTSRHLIKVYPSGKRTDSTNMQPCRYWIAGIQHVTMNVQTVGEELDLNNGLFSINNSCGYVLKPKWMRDGIPTSYNDLMKRNTKMILRVQVISGQCLPRPFTKYSDAIVDPYVTVETFGYAFDNQKHRTAVVDDNGFNPIWNSEHFVIPLKVPELTLLRFCVKDRDRLSSNDFIGQYTIPVMSVTPGYSHVPLLTGLDHTRDPSAAIFVHVEVDCALTEEELTSALWP